MNRLTEKLASGNYRSAAETIVEKMKTIAEEKGDQQTVDQLENILGNLFDLPNIDWKKAEEQGIYAPSTFIE